MSTRINTRRAAVATLCASAAMVASLFTAAQAEPAPTLDSVKAMYHEAEVATEKLNGLNAEITATQREIDDLNADITAIESQYSVQKEALAAIIVEQHMAAPLGPTVSLLGSEDPQAFIDGLGAVQAYNSSQSDALDKFSEMSEQLQAREDRLAARKAALDAAKAEAGAKKAEIDKKISTAQAASRRLSAADRRTLTASNISFPTDVAAPNSAVAAAVVAFARAQLGDPYVYGGTGPDSWDCSGLTQAAYRAAGISIPRDSGSQIAAATPVPMSQIQPGDLVYYSGHIAIYIGGGRVIHAPYPGKTVEVDAMYHYYRAGRFG